MRRHNRALVLRTVAAEEPVSRARVAARTGLTRGTVSSLVEELLAAGLLAELAAARGATGRPASPLQLNRSGPAGLGVEIGVDAVGACVVDLTGTVRAERVAASGHRNRPAAAGLEAAAALAAEVVARGRAADRRGRAGGARASSPAACSSGRRTCRSGATSTSIARAAAVLAPVIGDAPVCRRATRPTSPRWPSTGPARRATTSSTSRAGSASAPGSCWAGGCSTGRGAGPASWATSSSTPPGRGAPAVAAAAWSARPGWRTLCRAAGVGDLDALAAAADRREPAADAALRAGGHALGVALAGAVNLLDVPTVVLGGGYPRLGAVLRDAVADELARRVVWRSRVAVRVSALGAAAALRGAATMVVRAVLDG